MPGRFIFGVGTGENINEHILGEHWPPADIRQQMLEEAIEIIRLLWQGEQESFYGRYYTVENARLYTLPDKLPPLMIAAGGLRSAELAGRIGDGFIGTSPSAELLKKFDEVGGKDKPRYAEVTVCWAEDEAKARQTAYKHWPVAAIKGELTQELPAPSHFEQAAEMVSEEDIAKAITCGPDLEPYVDAIKEYADAGYERVWIHQVGPDREGFFKFYERELAPGLNRIVEKPKAASRQ